MIVIPVKDPLRIARVEFGEVSTDDPLKGTHVHVCVRLQVLYLDGDTVC